MVHFLSAGQRDGWLTADDVDTDREYDVRNLEDWSPYRLFPLLQALRHFLLVDNPRRYVSHTD